MLRLFDLFMSLIRMRHLRPSGEKEFISVTYCQWGSLMIFFFADAAELTSDFREAPIYSRGKISLPGPFSITRLRSGNTGP